MRVSPQKGHLNRTPHPIGLKLGGLYHDFFAWVKAASRAWQLTLVLLWLEKGFEEPMITLITPVLSQCNLSC